MWCLWRRICIVVPAVLTLQSLIEIKRESLRCRRENRNLRHNSETYELNLSVLDRAETVGNKKNRSHCFMHKDFILWSKITRQHRTARALVHYSPQEWDYTFELLFLLSYFHYICRGRRKAREGLFLHEKRPNNLMSINNFCKNLPVKCQLKTSADKFKNNYWHSE